MLGDEPVSSLDPITSRGILDLFVRIHRQDAKRITIVNLHDQELALAYFRRIIGLREGQLVYDGPSEDVTPEVLRHIYGQEETASAVH